MRPIVNKDNELIKRYLEVRQELIEEFKKNFDTNFFTYDNLEHHLDNWLRENIEIDGKIDSLLVDYDDHITSTKLSEKAKELLDLMLIVDYDYIAYDDNSYKPKLNSFKNINEQAKWIEKLEKEYEYLEKEYDFNFYYLEIKEIIGSLEDNYDELYEKYENGDALFIRVDSIYTNNIKIAVLSYTD
jgi:hypothetical protein